jgi:sugar phosphate isomerase/epimerase
VAQLKEMAPAVGKIGGPCILLEPLNRYEGDFLTRQAKAVELIRKVNSASVQLMCDLFHMNIEEPDIPAALKKAGPMCRHVHLADNTRMEPGSGSLDFKGALAGT